MGNELNKLLVYTKTEDSRRISSTREIIKELCKKDVSLAKGYLLGVGLYLYAKCKVNKHGYLVNTDLLFLNDLIIRDLKLEEDGKYVFVKVDDKNVGRLFWESTPKTVTNEPKKISNFSSIKESFLDYYGRVVDNYNNKHKHAYEVQKKITREKNTTNYYDKKREIEIKSKENLTELMEIVKEGNFGVNTVISYLDFDSIIRDSYLSKNLGRKSILSNGKYIDTKCVNYIVTRKDNSEIARVSLVIGTSDITKGLSVYYDMFILSGVKGNSVRYTDKVSEKDAKSIIKRLLLKDIKNLNIVKNDLIDNKIKEIESGKILDGKDTKYYIDKLNKFKGNILKTEDVSIKGKITELN